MERVKLRQVRDYAAAAVGSQELEGGPRPLWKENKDLPTGKLAAGGEAKEEGTRLILNALF